MGIQVYLVAGGWNFNTEPMWTGGYMSSTEVMEATATSWSFAGDLPSARRDLAGISLSNQIFLTGGTQEDEPYFLSDILEFNKETGEWIKTAEMSITRSNH